MNLLRIYSSRIFVDTLLPEKLNFKKWFIKRNYSIRLLQLFFLLISMLGILIAPGGWLLVGLFSYTVLETLGGNIALHRYFGHKSFKTNRFWHVLLAFLGHYIGVGMVISWVGQHRYHHKYSDTPRDVHSVDHGGIFKILFGIWKVKIESAMVRDVMKDPVLKFFQKNYWSMHIGIILVFFTLDIYFKTWLLFSLYALPNLMCLMSGYALAIVTHKRGYRTYELPDKSFNCWVTNVYTLGEGWHNNHHARPEKMRQGEKWWEWDLPAFVVEKFIEVQEPSRPR
jgi:sn-1 stearoyl-lipid 9-desaturase